jgi:hypothetical protein
LGMDVSVGDADGDGRVDLIATVMYGDAPERWDAGKILVFSAGEDGTLAAEPTIEIASPQGRFQLGESAVALGDVNGDGVGDFATHSNLGGTEWEHVGRPYFVASGEEGAYALMPLDMPWEATGTRFGWGVGLPGDINGDGFDDAFVTAPRATHSRDALAAGQMFFYPGTADGISADGQQVPRFAQHTAWDFIKKVTGIGDFDGDGHPDFAVLISHDDRPNQFDETYALTDGDCPAPIWDQGGVYIFLGGPERFDFTPDFVFFGSGGGDAPEVIAAGHDFNGDALADLALGIQRRDGPAGGDVGAAVVVTGRADAHPDKLTVICQPFLEHTGVNVSDHLGFSVAFVDDLNADGCDELAVGVRLDDADGFVNQGGVHILYGHGGASCFAAPHIVRLNSGRAYGQMGWSIASGDVDGDGLAEIAVGTPYELVAQARRGAVWVLPGSELATFEPLPFEQDAERGSFWIDDVDGLWILGGQDQGSEAGRGVAIIEGLVAMSTLREVVAGVAEVGTVRFYRAARNGGLQGQPVAILVGETFRPGSQLGESMSVSPDGTHLLVGALRGGGNGHDNGSAYLLDLSILSP